MRAENGTASDLTSIQARKVRARRPSEWESIPRSAVRLPGFFIVWPPAERERNPRRQDSKQLRHRTAAPVQQPVRRAKANHRTACVGWMTALRSEESSSVGEHLTHHQTVEGSTPSFFYLVKALNRLAVRIRLSMQYPGNHPRGRQPVRCFGTERLTARNADTVSRGGESDSRSGATSLVQRGRHGCRSLRQARRSSIRAPTRRPPCGRGVCSHPFNFHQTTGRRNA